MPALNFKPEFATAVASGIKHQTIRARRRDGRDPKPGDTLHLYTGMRTKKCRKLGEARCESVEPVRLTNRNGGEVWLGGKRLLVHDAFAFARADGLPSLEGFLWWFERVHGLPFDGLVIRWNPPQQHDDARRREPTAASAPPTLRPRG